MKKFLTLFLVVVLTMVPLTLSFAATDDLKAPEPSYVFENSLDTTVKDTAAKIAGIIQVVGIAIALVVLVAFGVQWLIATPAKKADLKGKLWNILIGLIILLLGTTILNTVVDFILSIK